MNKLRKNEKGITLIALVVTIIVLLILAGVSIATLTKQNGILAQATKAKDETIEGEEKEQIEISYISAALNKIGDTVTSEELQTELNKLVGVNKTQVTGVDMLKICFSETKHNYKVKNRTGF